MDRMCCESRLPPKPCAHMPIDAVSDPYMGPGIGGLGPTLQSYQAHERVNPQTVDMVLRSLNHLLIFHRRDLFSHVQISRS